MQYHVYAKFQSLTGLGLITGEGAFAPPPRLFNISCINNKSISQLTPTKTGKSKRYQ